MNAGVFQSLHILLSHGFALRDPTHKDLTHELMPPFYTLPEHDRDSAAEEETDLISLPRIVRRHADVTLMCE